MKAGPSGSTARAQDQLHAHVILPSQDGDLSHLCLYKATLAAAFCTCLQTKKNDAKYVFIFCLLLQPAAASATHTSPQLPTAPSEWGASRELSAERMWGFQKPLSLRIAFFPPPPFSLDVRFQHALIWCYFSPVFGLWSCVGL